MILSAIAAMSRNRVIGKNNQLPWNIPADLKYFKDKTKGKILIMGRKTYESLGRPLPQRFHIVITRQSNFQVDQPMVKVVSSLSQAIEHARTLIGPYPEEVMVVGGGEIYQQAIPYLDKIYLTMIDADFEGDAYFPEFSLGEFQLESFDPQQGDPPFVFLVYKAQRN